MWRVSSCWRSLTQNFSLPPKKSSKTLGEYFSSKDRRWVYYNRRDGAFWASECFGVHDEGEGGTSEEYSVVVVTVRSPPLSNKRHLFKCFRRCSETVQSQQKREYYKSIPYSNRISPWLTEFGPPMWQAAWSWHRADTVCFACHSSGQNSVTMAKFC